MCNQSFLINGPRQLNSVLKDSRNTSNRRKFDDWLNSVSDKVGVKERGLN